MKNLRKTLAVSLALLAVLIFTAAVITAETNKEMFISESYGSVMIKKSGTSEFVPVKKDMQLAINDAIKTGKNSYCEIAFDKEMETMVSIKENSLLVINKASIDSMSNKEETLLDLQSGSVMTKVKKLTTEASQFKIKTPTSIVGVRGTNFEIKVVE